MLKHITLLGSAALTLSLTTMAIGQDEVTADTVVAKVGDTEITVGQIIVARGQLPQQYSQFPNEALFNGLIDQLIQQQLLADALEYVPPGIAEEVTQFNASHLLVETEEEAQAAKARLDEGAEFADVARDVSTGPTGPNGGNLGWFGPGAMVPEFETAITALEPGQVTEPFETQFGWHVATLMDELRLELSSELQEAAITARLEELAAAQDVVKPADGDFDPNIINQVELLE